MWRIIFLLLLSSCYTPPPDHIIGIWNRISSNDIDIPLFPFDKIIFTEQGNTIVYRNDKIYNGKWITGEFTFEFGYPTTLTMYPDKSWNGFVNHITYSEDTLILHNSETTDILKK